MGSAIEIEHLSFTFPDGVEILRDASLTVPGGSFYVITGPTGSGKSTLLRLLKPEVAPQGNVRGERLVLGRSVQSLDPRPSAELLGFVGQHPAESLVSASVARELAFGLESLGMDRASMRRRVAETVWFFDMGDLYRAKTSELSGGEQATVLLASVVAMGPRILLLDEPMAELDPVARREFLHRVFRLVHEAGMTVLMATHEPKEAAAYADAVFVLAGGCISPWDSSEEVNKQPDDATTDGSASFPSNTPVALAAQNLWFRYGKRWVLDGLDLTVREGEVRALVGANGSGKSTLLRLCAGLLKPSRGHVRSPHHRSQAWCPQNPKALFTEERVDRELMAWATTAGYGRDAMGEMAERCGLSGKLDRHPYDLSGGEQHLLALAKLLLTRPQIMFLDEPARGLDSQSTTSVIRLLRETAEGGTTVVLASHSMDFVRDVADSVSLLFDGSVAVTEETAEFFTRSLFHF